MDTVLDLVDIDSHDKVQLDSCLCVTLNASSVTDTTELRKAQLGHVTVPKDAPPAANLEGGQPEFHFDRAKCDGNRPASKCNSLQSAK